MSSTVTNMLALVAKIEDCRKIMEGQIAAMGVFLKMNAWALAAFDAAIREGVEHQSQLQRDIGFQVWPTDALNYKFPRPVHNVPRPVHKAPRPTQKVPRPAQEVSVPIQPTGSIIPAKRQHEQAPEGRQPLAPIDGNVKKKPGARVTQSSFSRNIRELYPAKGQSYERDQDTGKFKPRPQKNGTQVDEEARPVARTMGINETAPSGSAPWKDEQGFIHVGGQPIAPQAAVKSAPQERAFLRLKVSVNATYNSTDKHFSHMNESLGGEYRAVLHEYLAKSLSRHPEDETRMKQYCDYTGVEMTWAEVSLQFTLEGIHPFAVAANGQATYHIPPNVGTCTYALNMGKNQWPVIVLALMGEASRLYQDRATMNFDIFKKRWTWVYRALTNVMLTSAFKLRVSHDDMLSQVNTWSAEKKKEFLEALRTGTYLPIVHDQIMTMTREELFSYRTSSWSKEKSVNWAKVYRKLQLTAAKHGGLSESEFEISR
ncbi:unnamed protein product [Clonostachys rosea]|uniref:Helitron helicase-like domain-containing protein n=1 Tax=Bionectria ochroleuca TaxID=29856 RepID=A0ABY6ULS5_BIOOC|nr:unnamed protein product [Clonostachys rosea]